ncbi:MAG: signal peptidase I [Chloroflexota bacterium]
MVVQSFPKPPHIAGKSPVVPRSWPVSLAVELISGAALLYIYKRRIVVDMLETVFLAIFLFLGINAVSARIRVESVSMEPTLYAGDFVFVNRVAYTIGKPERGDVIVFRYPPDPTQIPYIKRVIGLPGDRIDIENGQVLVNGYPLTEPYLKDTTSRGGSWTVPAGSLFVMGDNRNNSSDSRAWGYVPYENVIGKAEVIYLPVKHWDWLHQSLAIAAEPIHPPPTSGPLPTATPAAAYPAP